MRVRYVILAGQVQNVLRGFAVHGKMRKMSKKKETKKDTNKKTDKDTNKVADKETGKESNKKSENNLKLEKKS